MAKFRQHVISTGDTIQSIAQDHLGDMNKWVEIAQFNGLRHPYIVDTVEEKLKDSDRTMTYGDVLLIDVGQGTRNDLITTLRTSTEYDTEAVMALALGKDLDIMPVVDIYGIRDKDSDNLELKANQYGDLKTVRGVENMKQALYVRLATPRGSYLGHPKFGSDILKYLGGKNNELTATEIDLEIERTLRTDGRVTGVSLASRQIKGTTYTAQFIIQTMSTEQAFDFVISAREDGIIKLEDNYVQN